MVNPSSVRITGDGARVSIPGDIASHGPDCNCEHHQQANPWTAEQAEIAERIVREIDGLFAEIDLQMRGGQS